ncbi:MAG: hypothetical protein ACI93R_001270 [Flavobacteriales bacterium]|jgi:hypothetical protein
MKFLLFGFFILMSFDAFAELGVSGKWSCDIFPKQVNPQLKMSYTIEVNADETSFVRSGIVIFTPPSSRKSVIEIGTQEEGTVTIVENTLTLTPLAANTIVLKGRHLLKDDDPSLKEAVLENETGEIEFVDENTYKIDITQDGSGQLNVCSKIL